MVFALFRGCLSDECVADGTSKEIVESTHRCDDDSSLGSDHSKATLLEAYASRAQWDAVVSLVAASRIDDWLPPASPAAVSPCSLSDKRQESSSSLQSQEQHSLFRTQTPLHLALQHGAPLHVVESLICILKEKLHVHAPEEIQDDEGRTPLHIAVAVGCEENVALRLLEGDNLVMPAVLRDTEGKTPLHEACASPVLQRKKSAGRKANRQYAMDQWNKRRVIDLLVNQYPEACSLTDVYNKTPLAYAIENKLQRHTVHGIQAAETWNPSRADSSDDLSQENLDSLANTDVPMVVPSIPGSTCRVVLTRESIARLDKLLLEDWKSEGEKDVSTIGDYDCVEEDIPQDMEELVH